WRPRTSRRNPWALGLGEDDLTTPIANLRDGSIPVAKRVPSADSPSVAGAADARWARRLWGSRRPQRLTRVRRDSGSPPPGHARPRTGPQAAPPASLRS